MTNETQAASMTGIDQRTMEGWLVDAYASIEDDLEAQGTQSNVLCAQSSIATDACCRYWVPSSWACWWQAAACSPASSFSILFFICSHD